MGRPLRVGLVISRFNYLYGYYALVLAVGAVVWAIVEDQTQRRLILLLAALFWLIFGIYSIRRYRPHKQLRR